MLTISLFDPQIPPNTGNIARLCGANNIKLDLVGDLGFDINDRYLKRAGLDYWDFINYEIFPDINEGGTPGPGTVSCPVKYKFFTFLLFNLGLKKAVCNSVFAIP